MKTTYALLSVLSLLPLACARAPARTQGALAGEKNIAGHEMGNTQRLAIEQGAHRVTEIRFAPGSAALSPKDRARLHEELALARREGQEPEEVKIISWADQEYPSSVTKKLSPEQQRLAIERGETIKRALQETDADRKMKLKAYSMARRPDALENFFHTSESRVKASLEKAGIPDTRTQAHGPSFAGKALVMMLTREATLSAPPKDSATQSINP